MPKPSAVKRKQLVQEVQIKDEQRRQKLVESDKRKLVEQERIAARRRKGCCRYKLELPSVFIDCIDCPDPLTES